MLRLPPGMRVAPFYALIGLAIAIALEVASRGSFSVSYGFFTHSAIAAGITWAVIVAACVFLDSLIGRRYIGSLFIGLILIAVGFASAEKQKYLPEPLLPWDFLFVSQVTDLLPQLVEEHPFVPVIVAIALVTFVSLTIFFLKHVTPKTIRFKGRLIGVVLSLTVLVPFSYGAAREGRKLFRDYFGIANNVRLQAQNYRRNGFLVAFTLNINDAFVRKPDHYSADTIGRISTAYARTRPRAAADEHELQKPNVVMIMSEAFWNPTQFPNVTFDEDPIPFVHSLSKGDIFSPAFAVLSSYTQGIIYSDRALRRLTEHLKTLKRPTILVFFGDHVPSLGNRSIYRSAGLLDEPKYRGAVAAMRVRRTPLVIWSSTTEDGPHLGTLSPAFIPLVLMERLNLKHPFYRNFLGEVRKEVRVNDKYAFVSADMQIMRNPPERLKPLLDQYYGLQYDQMFGSRYSDDPFFCEVPGRTCNAETSVIAMPAG